MSTPKLRQDALDIFRAGLQAVAPEQCIRRFVARDANKLIVADREYDLEQFHRVYVVGAGKAGAAMAAALEEIVGDRLTDGIVNIKYGHTAAVKVIRINEAGHPIPDDAGMQGARDIAALLAQTGDKDLVICLISGGGSALLPLPVNGIALREKQELTNKLLACGAAIHEINAVRKHVSQIKGGQLARMVHPSQLITLILSDVVGDPLDAIASGPTVADPTTFQDVASILQRYGLWEKLAGAIRNHLEKGLQGKVQETPKAGDAIFNRAQNIVIGSNLQAIRAAGDKAAELGYAALILSSSIEGETREVARVHAAIAREIVSTGNPLTRPACVLSGGETTVTIRGDGKGGRNQEFSLAAALDIAGLDSVVILSAGTDGTDGPTDAAGAICDGESVARARDLGLTPEHHLRNNDAYPLFAALDDLVMTGPTNTNVMDLRLILAGRD